MKTPAKKFTLFLQRTMAVQNPAAYEALITAAFDEFKTTLDDKSITVLNSRRIAKNLRSLSLILLNLIYLADERINDMDVYNRLRSKLSDLYRGVSETAATYLPGEGINKILQPLPFSNLISGIREIEIRLKNNAVHHPAYQIFTPHLMHLNTKTKLPFYRWLWWQNFYALSLQNENDEAGNTLMDMLIQLNFNTPEFVALLLKHIKNEADAAGALIGRQTVLQDYMIRYKCMHHGVPGFYAAAASLKKTMLQTLKLQLRSMRLPAYCSHATTINAAPSGTGKLVTTLSVAQLAVLLRLLLDEEVISTTNQSDLFRLVSLYVQTTRTQSISADSLRNKFYSPDNAAKNIVKEHLLLMLNRVRQY